MMTLQAPTRCVFRTDGTVLFLNGPQTMAQLEALIGCTACDTVMLWDHMHVMIVDDTGHQRGLPINAAGTAFYQKSRPGSPWVVRGDIVIVPDSDYAKPDGMPYSNRPL